MRKLSNQIYEQKLRTAVTFLTFWNLEQMNNVFMTKWVIGYSAWPFVEHKELEWTATWFSQMVEF